MTFSVLIVGISGAVLVRLPKSPNRGLAFAILGLGVLETVPLDEGGTCCGLKTGIIPRPDGAGVASRADGIIRLGDGFREVSRLVC